MIAIVAITIYTSYSDYEKIASSYIAAYSHRHFADASPTHPLPMTLRLTRDGQQFSRGEEPSM